VQFQNDEGLTLHLILLPENPQLFQSFFPAIFFSIQGLSAAMISGTVGSGLAFSQMSRNSLGKIAIVTVPTPLPRFFSLFSRSRE